MMDIENVGLFGVTAIAILSTVILWIVWRFE